MIIFIIIILLIVLGIFFFSYLMYHKKKLYSYDTSMDYNYAMNSTPILISLTNNQFILPKEICSNSTIFCKLKIKSTLLGQVLQPNIQVNDNKSSKQYYEVGTNGYRYLKLSNLSDENRIIKFKTKRCSIFNETVEVYTYKNDDISNSKILIIAPHPDDAEISSYGLYSSNAENCFLLTITCGEYGNRNYEAFDEGKKNDLARMKLRLWNSLTVPMLGDVPSQNLLNLGYDDYSLEKMYKNKEKTYSINKEIDKMLGQMNPIDSISNTERSWHTLVQDIKNIITKIEPNIIITPHPYLDEHPDHIYSTVAVIEALKENNYNKGNLFLYTIHNTLNPYYPFGKLGSCITLPPLFDNVFCFDSIYSLELNKEQQANKILAFEAMNDLRLGLKILNIKSLFSKMIKTIKHRILDIEKDYYNRFIRSNELFYIVPFQEAERFIKGILNKRK